MEHGTVDTYTVILDGYPYCGTSYGGFVVIITIGGFVIIRRGFHTVEHRGSRGHNYHGGFVTIRREFHTPEHRTVDTYTVDHHTAEFRV